MKKEKIEKTKSSWYETNRCRWREGQDQCQMLGSISLRIGVNVDFYCVQHFYCLNNPKEKLCESK